MKQDNDRAVGTDGARRGPCQCPGCEADLQFLRSVIPAAAPTTAPTLRIADLFCGCGGLTLGLVEAARHAGRRAEVVLAVDHDRDARAVYEANFGVTVDAAGVERLFDGDDHHWLTPTEVAVRGRVRTVDILAAGPPCQGNSDLNNRTRRVDLRNDLYASVARAAFVLEPRVIVIENVASVIHDQTRVVERTRAALEATGYDVADATLNLLALGVPQTRRRHVLLGTSGKEGSADAVIEALRSRCHASLPRTVGWAIDDLAGTDTTEVFDSASTPSAANRARIDYLFDAGLYDLPNEYRPVCHQSQHSYLSMYGRLASDRPAQTITTGFGSMGQGRFVHPTCRRTITPHEAARLQTFPDSFDFSQAAGRGKLARLIGNAVPPLLGIELGRVLMKYLDAPNDACVDAEQPAITMSDPAVRPAPSSPAAAIRMKRVRQTNTEPEVVIGAALTAAGLNYRTNVTVSVPGVRSRPDFIFDEERVAVFVDGCFWHCCPDHGTQPKANAEWWQTKLEQNQARDKRNTAALEADGWRVVRAWEHEEPQTVAARVLRVTRP